MILSENRYPLFGIMLDASLPKPAGSGAPDIAKPTFVAATGARVHRSCHSMPKLQQLSVGKRRLGGLIWPVSPRH